MSSVVAGSLEGEVCLEAHSIRVDAGGGGVQAGGRR